MYDFTVDIGGLDALGKNLDRTVENIETATKKLADMGPDSIGSDDLDEACADFRSGWEEGLEKLKESVSEIRDGVGQAMHSYAELENGLRESLTKMAQGIGDAGIGSRG